MIDRPFENITKADVDDLIANKVAEDRTLEYKQQLPGNSNSDKMEFLSDVSAFANAAGGDLLYGVSEARENNKPTARPERADGLTSVSNEDVGIRRLEEILRYGIEPRMVVRIRAVPGFAAGPVILVRVSKGWNGPHMVKFDNHSRFYVRTSAGKHQMDVGEIRTACALSEALGNRVRRFRDERLGRILADETPVPLVASARIVLHLYPADTGNLDAGLDVREFAEQRARLTPISFPTTDARYNFDGYLTTTTEYHTGSAWGYVQVFRIGAIEAVDTFTLQRFDDSKFVRMGRFEEVILDAIQRYLAVLNEIQVRPPIFGMVSMLAVKGYRMHDQNQPGVTSKPIDRDVLLLPDVVFEEYEADIPATLRSVFDALWQAAGYPGCPFYSSDGKWTQPGK